MYQYITSIVIVRVRIWTSSVFSSTTVKREQQRSDCSICLFEHDAAASTSSISSNDVTLNRECCSTAVYS
jgi:hypothetical protein